MPPGTAVAISPKSRVPQPCRFCFTSIREPSMLGLFYKYGDLYVHYYCVLLARNVPQKGKDEEGLLGFLIADIKKGLRAAKLKACYYCGENGASLKCESCQKKFHLPCGLLKNALSIFKGAYVTFCKEHRPAQKVPMRYVKQSVAEAPMCMVCIETVNVKDMFNSLWAPCCKKTWYHRKCIQGLAYSQASLFKCCLCSKSGKFKTWMINNGICIPVRDASWELENGAFDDLYRRHNTCDVDFCQRRRGREACPRGGPWKVVLCQSCGASGTHLQCSNLQPTDTWLCAICKEVETRPHSGPEPSAEAISIPMPSVRVMLSPLRGRWNPERGLRRAREDDVNMDVNTAPELAMDTGDDEICEPLPSPHGDEAKENVDSSEKDEKPALRRSKRKVLQPRRCSFSC